MGLMQDLDNHAEWRKVFAAKSSSKLSRAGGFHPIKVAIPREICGEMKPQQTKLVNSLYSFTFGSETGVFTLHL